MLELDKKAQAFIKELKSHYSVKSTAEIISKSLALLKIASHIEKTGGELLARKGVNETKIVV